MLTHDINLFPSRRDEKWKYSDLRSSLKHLSDGIEDENKPNFLNDNPLVKYSQNNDNLILTPHMAGLTFDSEIKAQTAALKLLLEVM